MKRTHWPETSFRRSTLTIRQTRYLQNENLQCDEKISSKSALRDHTFDTDKSRERAREWEKLSYLIKSEKDDYLRNQMIKYRDFLKEKINMMKEMENKETKRESGKIRGKKEKVESGEKIKSEGEEEEEDNVMEKYGEGGKIHVREMLLKVKPLPPEFFCTMSEGFPMNTVRELEDMDKSISEETDEDMKLRMQQQRKIILKSLNKRLKEIGAVQMYDQKLTFNDSVSERMRELDALNRYLQQYPELNWEEEEERKVKERKEPEEMEKLVEEDIPLSELIAGLIPDDNSPKFTENHMFVKPLSNTVPAPLTTDSEIVKDEYDYDSSDEEDIRNTVGNIPMRWYDDCDHLGYDWEGNKIVKPPAGDELDNFLQKMEDPDFWRTVKDPQTGQDIVLCNADVEVIQRLKNSKIPDEKYEEYGPWIEWFSSEVMRTPVCDVPEHKRSFLPSRDEERKVRRIVYAIKKGWIKPKKKKPKKKEFYMLWETDNTAEPMRRIHNHIYAPKRSLPGHAESYNPPAEYLFDKKERKQWKKSRPSQRKLHFVPSKYSALRHVPAYDKYTEERFRRCLDLYLCPRTRKMKLLIEPDDLLPKLPSPRDLQPFPTTQSLVYKGHKEMIRTISVETKGQYLASGSDDSTVKLWEVATGRCIRTIPVGGIVRSVSWCPNVALSLLAVAADKKLLLINPCVGDILVVKKTDILLEEQPEQDVLVSERLTNAIQWEQATGDDKIKGIRVIINHFKEIKQVTWHGRGDYFATVMPDAQNRSVIIHQISKRRSQIPFARSKGLVQCVLFHPIRPIFFVATQKFVRIYDLVKQSVMKKLFSNAKWISTMAIHPAGDNLLVGTYDRKVLWFDLDLSTKPYQTLRLHSGGIRGVAYHKNYPLFATSSDDKNIIVSHGMVYNDLLKNALIVPLKKLSFHEKVNDFSVLDIVFHPTQPWLFSTGADCTIRLYT